MPRRARLWFPTRDAPGVWEDRQQFLEAVRLEAPVVLEQLRERAWPHWNAAFGDPAMSQALRVFRESGCTVALPSQLESLQVALHAWSVHFNLEVPWVTAAAAETLHDWASDPPRPRDLCWAHPATLGDGFVRGANWKRGRLVAAPRKRRSDHFRWLARWQVLGESGEKIAEIERSRRSEFEAARLGVEMMLRGSAGQANYANALEAQKRLALAEQAERVLGRHKVKGFFILRQLVHT